MEQYVCVRMVQANAMDLGLFQFDYNLTFAAFMMNADKTIYGRYGTRSAGKEAGRDISLESFGQALEGGLELHKNVATYRAALKAKRGAAPRYPIPERYPSLARYKPKLDYQGNVVKSCMHCHQIHEAELKTVRASGQPVTDKLLWPYPLPDTLGFSLDPKEKATVKAVAPNSEAQKAGFKVGDQIVKLDGQPMLSIADVQWVLHNAREPSTVKAEVQRGGKNVQITLAVPKGWRQKSDFTWRILVWYLRHQVLGTAPLKELSADERKQHRLSEGNLALLVKIPPGWVKAPQVKSTRKFLRNGDIIVALEGNKKRISESTLLAYLIQQKKPGQKVSLTILRGGREQTLQLPLH